MNKTRRRAGFTLIELLVVISIIMVLAAILYPVFQSVRKKARETQCISNLHQIAVGIKAYRSDHGHYPLPPVYADGRYSGGISALFPEYISDTALLICPDDRQIDGVQQAAKERVYSSYNGFVAAPDPADEVSWQFQVGGDMWDTEFHSAMDPSVVVSGPARYYNYHCYTQEGVDAFDWGAFDNDPANHALPTWMSNQGLRWRHYPRLSNRGAPNNTYITHCPHHRESYSNEAQQIDIYVNVGGSTKKVNTFYMKEVSGGVSPWVKQSE